MINASTKDYIKELLHQNAIDFAKINNNNERINTLMSKIQPSACTLGIAMANKDQKGLENLSKEGAHIYMEIAKCYGHNYLLRQDIYKRFAEIDKLRGE